MTHSSRSTTTEPNEPCVAWSSAERITTAHGRKRGLTRPRFSTVWSRAQSWLASNRRTTCCSPRPVRLRNRGQCCFLINSRPRSAEDQRHAVPQLATSAKTGHSEVLHFIDTQWCPLKRGR